MSAPNYNSLGPPIVNPPGQGFNGQDPNFTVPRINGAGNWVRHTPGSNAGFMNFGNQIDNSPLDYIDQVIRREDFPDGLEGQKAYEAALASFNATAGPPPQGDAQIHTGTNYGLFNAAQAGQSANQGGSSGLAVQSWASNNPEAALSAVMAMAAGTVDESDQNYLDDSVLRDLIVGLGGPEAVNAMIEQERSGLIELGLIPENIGEPSVPGGPNQGGGEEQPWWAAQGLPPPGDGSPTPWYNPDIRTQGPGDTQNSGQGADGAPLPDRSGATPRGVPQNPDRSGATPQGVPQNPPYEMAANGEVISDQPLPELYTYTDTGDGNVYLDVTGPDGMVHRFSGDIVEAAYTMLGFDSFDAMVNDPNFGIDGAFSAVMSLAQPQQPGADSGGSGGGAQPSPGGGQPSGNSSTAPDAGKVFADQAPPPPAGDGWIWDYEMQQWVLAPDYNLPPTPGQPGVPF